MAPAVESVRVENLWSKLGRHTGRSGTVYCSAAWTRIGRIVREAAAVLTKTVAIPVNPPCSACGPSTGGGPIHVDPVCPVFFGNDWVESLDPRVCEERYAAIGEHPYWSRLLLKL